MRKDSSEPKYFYVMIMQNIIINYSNMISKQHFSCVYIWYYFFLKLETFSNDSQDLSSHHHLTSEAWKSKTIAITVCIIVLDDIFNHVTNSYLQIHVGGTVY